MLAEDYNKKTEGDKWCCLTTRPNRNLGQRLIKNQNKLVTYDSLNDDDVQLGMQQRCNGIVHVLSEPIFQNQTHDAIPLIEKSDDAV